MPTLADIYSAADSFKRRLADAASNPSGSLQQMLGYANDRARNFNELQQQSLAETRQGGFANQGPATQELNQAYADAVMAGMTKPAANFEYRGSHTAPGPDFGAPLHDLTGGGQMYPSDVYSSKAVQYYGAGEPYDAKAFNIAQSFRDKPNATVTIYRAVPKEKTNAEKLADVEKNMAAYMRRGLLPQDAHTSNGNQWFDWAFGERERLRNLPDEPSKAIGNINPGDWVTLTREYAKDHGESALKGQYKIISKKVKAKDLWTNADSIHEFGYHPE